MHAHFDNIHALIIDMDGVLWHGNQPMDGLIEFFQLLRARNLPFVLATNNASQTAAQYVTKLAGMGVTVAPQEILTSAMATADYLAERVDAHATRVFVIGEAGLREPLQAKGFTLTDLYEVPGHGQGADWVICGMDRQLSWDKLATATLNLRGGAQFIATNADTTLPTELGIMHGNGAIIAALKASSEVTPTVIGKPEPIMYQQALKLLGIDPEFALAIGDRLETDILGAQRAGIRSLMVLSGISSQADIEAVDYAPTWVMTDIRAVTQALAALG